MKIANIILIGLMYAATGAILFDWYTPQVSDSIALIIAAVFYVVLNIAISRRSNDRRRTIS